MCAELYARCADRVRELMEFQVEICQAESRRLWEDRRQLSSSARQTAGKNLPACNRLR